MNTRLSFFAIGLLLSTSAWSEAPRISGNVDINVKTDNIINNAQTGGARAQVILGSFVSGSAADFKSTVTVRTVTNTANGNGACSQVVVGSVGHREC